MKKGFTLIELLVVVLIIGILAAIALPQYEKSVEKARAAEAMLMVRSIAEANRRYFLANSEYTYDLSNLDIEIPGENSSYGDMARKSTKFFMYGARANSSADLSGTIAIANRLPRDTFYSLRIFAGRSGVYCRGYSDKGEELCLALSGSNKKEDGLYYVIH